MVSSIVHGRHCLLVLILAWLCIADAVLSGSEQAVTSTTAKDGCKVWAVSFNLSVLESTRSRTQASAAFLFPDDSPAQELSVPDQYEVFTLQWDTPDGNWLKQNLSVVSSLHLYFCFEIHPNCT